MFWKTNSIINTSKYIIDTKKKKKKKEEKKILVENFSLSTNFPDAYNNKEVLKTNKSYASFSILSTWSSHTKCSPAVYVCMNGGTYKLLVSLSHLISQTVWFRCDHLCMY